MRFLAIGFLFIFFGSVQGTVNAKGQESLPALPPIPVEKVSVILRTLDKITARISELAVPLGETKEFGSLAITARYCRTRDPIETPETFSYLEIKDMALDAEANQVFTGWMLASSPALNPLEHSVYDVWVIACKTANGSDFTGQTDQSPSR